MEKSQRDYYLNEQVKAIQKELGEGEEGADIEELEKKIEAAQLPKEARKKVDSELKNSNSCRLCLPRQLLYATILIRLSGCPGRKKPYQQFVDQRAESTG